ncbi:MAG: hypothetical protein U5K77_03610 [Candidatus Saccharibacteria bacterium]|nr:hypothetical protein [Candidatus Saccharibacteria bacterium]
MHTTSLLTKQELKSIPELYKSEDLKVDDMIVHAKFFTPWSNWTWYVMEFDGEDRCYGYAKGNPEDCPLTGSKMLNCWFIRIAGLAFPQLVFDSALGVRCQVVVCDLLVQITP